MNTETEKKERGVREGKNRDEGGSTSILLAEKGIFLSRGVPEVNESSRNSRKKKGDGDEGDVESESESEEEE